MRMDLTPRHLQVVAAVHDTGSFTAAAAELLVAQSSLSRTVAEVEQRIGTPLFERTTRRLVPTAAGREFVAMAHRALAGLDAEIRHFEGYLAGRRGHVRVATLPSLAAILLPGVVSEFRAEYPRARLSIEDALSDEVLHRVRGGLVDLAVTVVSATTVSLDDLEVDKVAVDRFCCIVPRGHRFAARAELPWSALHGEPFIAFDATTSIRQHVDLALATAGVAPDQVVAARNIAAVAGLVAAELGVSVVPGLVLPLTGFAGLAHVPLRDPATHRDIAVLRAPERPLSALAAGFIATMTDAGRNRPPLPPQASWLPPV
jgi:LysR family transcriptional regulator, carnitine catabolism transcriptional activator